MVRHTRARRWRAWSAALGLLAVLSACGWSSPAAQPRPSTSTSPSAEASAPSASPSPTPRAGAFPYAALGDSYTSAPLVPLTDYADGCFRSSHNYPSLVAQAVGAALVDRSCVGATTSSVMAAQRRGIPPQIGAVTRRTRLVTVGLGGNEGGIFNLMIACETLRHRDPQGSPCRQRYNSFGPDVLLLRVQRMEPRLVAALQAVRARAPQALVLAVGYPTVVAPDHTCPALSLATGDYAYVASINQALNDAIRQAAAAAGAEYVDVATPTVGHDVCSADPWIQGPLDDRSRAAHYHPFAVEQRLVARLVTAAYQAHAGSPS